MRKGTAIALAALSLFGAAAWGKAKPVRIPSERARIDRAVDQLTRQTDVFWHRGDYWSVVAMFDIIVGLDPHDIEAWQDYGWLMWAGLNRNAAAMRIFQRGIAANPDRYELYFEAGNLEYHQRHFASAAAWMAKATARNAPWTIWHQRAHCLEYAGMIDKAKAVWREDLKRWPNDKPAKLNLDRILAGRIHRNPVIGVEPPKPTGPPEHKPVPPPPAKGDGSI